MDARRRIRKLCDRVDWSRLLFTGVMPLVAFIVGITWVPLQQRTAIFALAYASCSGIGITAGYHRLWSHRSYSASPILKISLSLLGASAGEGSIRDWSKAHRAHHRYVDTDMDPYSVHKGLFYAHYGWVILRQKPEDTGPVNIRDIDADHVVGWQHRNYKMILFLTAFIFPTLVCGLLFNDFTGGFIYASCLRVFTVQQRTFCINSLAHWVGERLYSEKHSPRDNWIVALITLGEGYHNFHHEFPMDYRNGYHWSAYDPTKWFISFCSFFRLSFDLKTFPENEIQKGLFQQTKTQLDRKEKVISWGQPLDELPVLSLAQYADSVRNGQSLIIIDGVTHDVSDFINHHPGGKALLWKNIGKDVTKMFRGDVYAHSNAATNLLSTMRFARIADSAGENN